MNFFDDQHIARQKTKKLVVLYILTVLITAISTGLIFSLYYTLNLESFHSYSIFHVEFLIHLLTHPSLWITSLVIIIMVISVSYFEIKSLEQGAQVIAKYAGAVPVPLETNDFKFKQYINIVQEMSIASGTPCPQIYYMPTENSINAFAAGFDIHDAVVAVSKGALEELDRDELQGVVAHEFSHIFNGDMLMNLKLIGYLAGLNSISQLGSRLMRTRKVSRKNSRGQTALFGFVILIIGSVGALLASLIKSALSRQREFLADASAVQFTRNPQGISGALQQILNSSDKKIKAANAAKISHFYFNEPRGLQLSGSFSIFSTHPPLIERITRIDKTFNVSKYKNKKRKEEEKTKRSEIISQSGTKPMPILEHVGELFSADFHDPVRLLNLGLCFFLGKDEIHAKNQIASFSNVHPLWQPEQFMTTHKKLSALSAKECLAVLDVYVLYLKKLSTEEQSDFLKKARLLIEIDQKICLEETLYYLFFKNTLRKRHHFFQQNHSIERLRSDIEVLLSFCIQLDPNQDQDEMFRSFSRYLFGGGRKKPYLTLELIEKSFKRIEEADPLVKKDLLNVVKTMIEDNSTQTAEELIFFSLLQQVLGSPSQE